MANNEKLTMTEEYNPERDITPQYLETAREWIAATNEMFVVMLYIGMAGSKDYAFIKTFDEFLKLIENSSLGTEFVIFKDKQLPLRGTVTEPFISSAMEMIAEGEEYMLVELSPSSPESLLHDGVMGDTHEDLEEDLTDRMGEMVALGPCPQFWDEDNERMVSASKGGIDGPR